MTTIDWDVRASLSRHADSPRPSSAVGLSADGRIVSGCNGEREVAGVMLCAECGMVRPGSTGGGTPVAVVAVNRLRGLCGAASSSTSMAALCLVLMPGGVADMPVPWPHDLEEAGPPGTAVGMMLTTRPGRLGRKSETLALFDAVDMTGSTTPDQTAIDATKASPRADVCPWLWLTRTELPRFADAGRAMIRSGSASPTIN